MASAIHVFRDTLPGRRAHAASIAATRSALRRRLIRERSPATFFAVMVPRWCYCGASAMLMMLRLLRNPVVMRIEIVTTLAIVLLNLAPYAS